ncbi:MAG: hypothetical protein Q4G04_01340 [bacterium]|nr:hypothetical protein [bacterium]
MGTGVLLTICSLLYVIILGIVYFKKKKIDSYENKIFSKIIISNVIGLILHLSLYCLMSFFGTNNVYTIVVSKVYLIYLITYMILFTGYVFIISMKNKTNIEKKYKLLMICSLIIIILLSFIICYLPIEFHNEIGKMYSYGKSVTVVYLVGFAVIFLNVIFLLRNLNNALDKKYYPLFLYFLLGLVTTLIQFKYPYIQLITAKDSLIIFLMYFTIENPDIKMIKELTYSKEVAERSKNETINILNDMSKYLKTSLDKLISFGYKKINKNNLEEVNKEINYFQKFSLTLADRISSLIDIAKIESSDYIETNNKYDTYEMLNDLKELINYKKGNKKITITTDISDNINKILYGDDEKVKKVVLYVTGIIVEMMKTGTVNITIDNMTVGRFCKLKFNFHVDNPIIKDYIEFDDSHTFKDAFEISDNNGNFIKKNINEFELNQKIVGKLLGLLNGEIDFKTEDNYTEVIVSLKQRVVPEYDIEPEVVTEENIKIKYFDVSDKRILVVDDNNTKIKELIRILRPYKVKIDIARNVDELKSAVESNKVYDLVMVDDIIPEPMDDVDAYGDVLEYSYSIKKKTKDLITRAKYDIPLIIMVTPNKNSYEEKYLKSGFDDYLIKPIKKSDVNNIMKKYFKKNNNR